MQVDNLPIKDDILKGRVKETMKELEKVPVPSKPELVKWNAKDTLPILKAFIQQQLLVVIGVEKPSLWQWVTLVVVILGIIAILAASIFPKLGIF
jgi:hypothetical protein